MIGILLYSFLKPFWMAADWWVSLLLMGCRDGASHCNLISSEKKLASADSID